MSREKGDGMSKRMERENLWFLFSVDEVVHFGVCFFKRRSFSMDTRRGTCEKSPQLFRNSKDDISVTQELEGYG